MDIICTWRAISLGVPSTVEIGRAIYKNLSRLNEIGKIAYHFDAWKKVRLKGTTLAKHVKELLESLTTLDGLFQGLNNVNRYGTGTTVGPWPHASTFIHEVCGGTCQDPDDSTDAKFYRCERVKEHEDGRIVIRWTGSETNDRPQGKVKGEQSTVDKDSIREGDKIDFHVCPVRDVLSKLLGIHCLKGNKEIEFLNHGQMHDAIKSYFVVDPTHKHNPFEGVPEKTLQELEEALLAVNRLGNDEAHNDPTTYDPYSTKAIKVLNDLYQFYLTHADVPVVWKNFVDEDVGLDLGRTIEDIRGIMRTRDVQGVVTPRAFHDENDGNTGPPPMDRSMGSLGNPGNPEM